VRAVATGEFVHFGDALVAAFGDDVGGTEFQAEIGAVLVPAHQDDPFGAQSFGGENCGKSDRAVTDHRDGGAGVDAGPDGAVVSGEEHIGQGEQRWQQLGVSPTGALTRVPFSERDPPGWPVSHGMSSAAPRTP
jgi:hypothetical protein